MLGIPKNAPKEFINYLTQDTETITKNMTITNNKKIDKRF